MYNDTNFSSSLEIVIECFDEVVIGTGILRETRNISIHSHSAKLAIFLTIKKTSERTLVEEAGRPIGLLWGDNMKPAGTLIVRASSAERRTLLHPSIKSYKDGISNLSS